MQAKDPNTLALSGFVLDLEQLELRDPSGTTVALRPQAIAVLLFLARNASRMVTRDELMRAVWPDVIVTDDSLVQCIKEIRRALQDDEHRIIRTEPKRGYRLVPPGSGETAPGLAPGEESFHQDIRFAKTSDGIRIAFAISGAGLPLVRAAHWMTHLDWDWRSGVFGPLIQALSRRFRFVRYDGRGCGLSDRNVAPGTLDESVGDLEAVVDAAGLQRFALFGPSGGAAIAIRYAARHPERVSRLVLLGGFARGALRRAERSMSPETFGAMARLIEEGWGQDNPAFRQLITSLLWPGATAEQMQSFNHLQRVGCSPRAAAELLRRVNEFDASSDLTRVRCPTLVLHSPHDSRVPFEEGRLIASTIEGARLELFDSPNHTPLPDEPASEQVRRSIEEFVHGGADVHVLADAATPSAAASRPTLRVVGMQGDPVAAPTARTK